MGGEYTARREDQFASMRKALLEIIINGMHVSEWKE